MRGAWVFGCLGALGFAPSAAASPVMELVGDVTGQGGLNPRVTGPSAASAYFNPALLARAPRETRLGLVVLSDQISMSLDFRRGGDVPRLVGDRNAFDSETGLPIPSDTLPTAWLEQGCSGPTCAEAPMTARPRQARGSSGNTRTYSALGIVSPLVERRLVLGIHAIVPMGEFTTAHSFYNDERAQFFSHSLHPELYSDRLTALSLAFGLGAELTESVLVGAGFTVNLINSAHSGSYVRNSVDYDSLLLSNAVSVQANMTPHFGVTVAPSEHLSFSGTLHTEQRFEVQVDFGAVLPVGNESTTRRTAVHNFMPMQMGLGARLDFTPHSANGISLVSTLTYQDWSSYVNRQGEAPGVYGPASEWTDTATVSAGLRYEGSAARGLVDAVVAPSPVPPQTGRANFVDNTRVGLALGGEWDLALGDLKLVPGVQLQGQHLLARRHEKEDARVRDELPDHAVDENREPIAQAGGLQTNNPGWPGFSSEGWVLTGSVYARFTY